MTFQLTYWTSYVVSAYVCILFYSVNFQLFLIFLRNSANSMWKWQRSCEGSWKICCRIVRRETEGYGHGHAEECALKMRKCVRFSSVWLLNVMNILQRFSPQNYKKEQKWYQSIANWKVLIIFLISVRFFTKKMNKLL